MSESMPFGVSVKILQRLDRAEELLHSHTRVNYVVHKLAKEFQVSPRTAWRYVRAVRKRWRAESRLYGKDREMARGEIRGRLDRLYEMAMARVTCDKDGKTYDNPDLATAMRVLIRIAEFEGIAEPVKHVLRVETEQALPPVNVAITRLRRNGLVALPGGQHGEE